jgi:hypothetical protein
MKTNLNPPALQPGFDFVPPASHAERLYRIGRDLAGDEAGLMKQARDAVKAYDAAIRSGEEDEAAAQRERLDAIAERLPEDDQDESSDERLQRMLAAVPGQVPLWGQAGGFLITVGKCRVIIRTDGSDMTATAFDWDKPFLTQSGYLELYGSLDDARGRTVKQCALWRIRHRSEWSGGKPRPTRLVPIVHYDWVHDPETGHSQRQEVPAGPDEEDCDWQPGGWLYQLKNSAAGSWDAGRGRRED